MAPTTLDFPVMQTIDHSKVKELRESQGLRQVQAAERANMSVSQWNDIESGRRSDNLKLETIARVAAALGVDDARNLITAPEKGKAKRKGK